MALLEIVNLTIAFRTEAGEVDIVENLDLKVEEGRVVALVGESGCGKSVTARSIMRLLPEPPSRCKSGSISFEGQDVFGLGERAMRELRGNRVSMIFQEPMTSLNPTYTVGFQIDEALRLHTDLTKSDRHRRSLELLDQVGIGAAGRRLGQYPFELSGGLRQRVMIAMAIACEPRLLIADEPTTALDVTVQAQILELLLRLRDETGMAILLITHDLGVVAETADEVAVMYAGRIVERSGVAALFQSPCHPYTRGLLQSIPTFSSTAGALAAIPGMVPEPGERPQGCSFYDRCARHLDRCRDERPQLPRDLEHAFACWNPGECLKPAK